MLTLEVELLTGVYRGSTLDQSAGEWPPHPERIFSAFVQAWGDGERDTGERLALEWLEAAGDPEIEASVPAETWERTSPTVFVPPNDAAGWELEALPERRRRQARVFRAVVPKDPFIRLRWPAEPPAEIRAALERITLRIASLGHSASLARLTFLETDLNPDRIWRPSPDGRYLLRALYPGRLADLERWFAAEPIERPRFRRTSPYHAPGSEETPSAASVFGGPESWFVFEDAGESESFTPDVLTFAHVARRFRDALMSVSPQPPPEMISGHRQDGTPSGEPHMAVLPLANVGWARSTGDLLGFAVVLPRTVPAETVQVALQALSRLVHYEGDLAQAEIRLSRDKVWRLERSPFPSRASLKPARWCQSSRVWASATPVVLDRYPDEDDPLEQARIIAGACRHIGLPDPIEIEIHKHSAVKGAPSAYSARGHAQRTWTFPKGSKLQDRPRRHVVLRFARPVKGPILLGAGRYQGFGLCLPTEEQHDYA